MDKLQISDLHILIRVVVYLMGIKFIGKIIGISVGIQYGQCHYFVYHKYLNVSTIFTSILEIRTLDNFLFIQYDDRRRKQYTDYPCRAY